MSTKCKVYEFTAYDPNERKEYTFKAYQLPGGQVLVPEEQTRDSFFENLDDVVAHGEDTIVKYEATGQTVAFGDDELKDAVTGSAEEFGNEAIP